MPRIVIPPQGSFRKGDPILEPMPFVIRTGQPIHQQASRARYGMDVRDVAEGIGGANYFREQDRHEKDCRMAVEFCAGRPERKIGHRITRNSQILP
jgi:hypothetical protein